MPSAPYPARGSHAEGFEPVARVFADALARRDEIGAGFVVHLDGVKVVDLHGGFVDAERRVPWHADTRTVLFSVTKGFAAMALMMLADRGRLDYDAPVATYWPGFAQRGKGAISVRSLLNHRAGLAALDAPLSMKDVVDPARYPRVRQALESQRPLHAPERGQAYHAITFGMYARELFEQIAGESMGAFLARELFGPLGADVSLGTGAEHDARIAPIHPPTLVERLRDTSLHVARHPDSTEACVLRSVLRRDSVARRVFVNPSAGPSGMLRYDAIDVRRAELAWASATGSAEGVSRAYLPFALGGTVDGRRYLRASTIEPVYLRQGWASPDPVLGKPLGWSQGFLKDEITVFSPNLESFGHPGMGGALGFCDPTIGLSIGYVMNRPDFRVRSPRALALCHALYACEPVRARMRR